MTTDIDTGLPSIGAARARELADRLGALIGADRLSTDPAKIERLSVDWAHMSPILSAQLPAGRADLIATPTSAEQIPEILRVAYQLEVPVTPRGTGLGNYGQAIPLHGGLLLDISACRAVEEIGGEGDGAWVRAVHQGLHARRLPGRGQRRYRVDHLRQQRGRPGHRAGRGAVRRQRRIDPRRR
jgi:hypothetical protein